MIIENLKSLLIDTLQLGSQAHLMGPQTRLLGAVPELDSMAVVQVIGALEEYFGIAIADDDINADIFQTLGTLAAFVQSKRA